MGSKALSLILNYSDDVKSVCTGPVQFQFQFQFLIDIE
jgi:hypothetical protein